MSRENVEIVRSFFELYRSGDHAAAAGYLASDVVYEIGQEMPARSPDQVRAMWRRWESDWDDLDTEPVEFIDAGDRVFVVVDYSARGRSSGITLADRTYEVYVIRQGKFVRRHEFRSREEALAAAGLGDAPSETRNERAARLFADAINAGDIDAALEICNPEIEFSSMLGLTGHAYVGHTGIRRYFEDIASAWGEWRVEVERVVEGTDGRVAILMTMHARGKESGTPLSDPVGHVWTVRDGRLIRNEQHRDPDAALREVGLDP